MSGIARRTGLAITAVVVLAAGSASAADTAQPLLKEHRFLSERKFEREVVCLPRAEARPVVDGVLDDAAWQKAYATDRFTCGGGKPGKNATQLLAAYDDTALYLAARCAVADPSKIKAILPESLRDAGGAWGEDCVDFKISPDSGVTTLQFIVTASGSTYDARNDVPAWNPEWERKARIGKDGYVIEMALPFAGIGLRDVRPGSFLFLWFGRADRTTGELPTLTEPYGDMARAQVFVLGAEADYRRVLSAGRFTRDVETRLYTDRDQYPSFQTLATGRVQMAFDPRGKVLARPPAIELALSKDGRPVGSQRIEAVETTKLDFDMPLVGLGPGAYALEARLLDGQEVFKTQRREFVILAEQAQRSGRIAVAVPPAAGEAAAWPVTFGVPFPWGALDSDENVRLRDPQGRETPIQTRVSCRWWKNGSVRWLLVDFLPPARTAPQTYTLEYGPDVKRMPGGPAVSVEDTPTGVSVDTGALRIVVAKKDTPGLGEAHLRGRKFFSADKTSGPYLVDEAGTRYLGSFDPKAQVVVESNGPLKACVRVSGWHTSEKGERLGLYILRYYAYAGMPWVRMYHTFIITADSDAVRYRDIGYSIPHTNSYCFFGTPRITPVWLRGADANAWMIQLDDLKAKVCQQGRIVDECEKSDGWVCAGDAGNHLTLAVKDFWQHFPKEIEVTPRVLTMHFWPAHGEERVRTGRQLSVQNNYHQWFAHEGKLLDFKVPEESLELLKADTEKYNYPAAKTANAIGLAKTHEMLLYFHTEDWEAARVLTTRRIFQDNLTATCDPAWVCGSGVFGRMAARQPGRFDGIEKALDETVACIFRESEQDRDYGMFNFGDAHHNWSWQDRRWSMHRIWRNTHHGWTRWPWLMYARTGSKAIFDWGDRNARHVADVDHCHYTTRDFETLQYPRGKCVGGICDYKGFVHWNSGNRLCYNSAADAMLDHHYLTGDERSLTAALEHGAALIAEGKALTHREGSGRATSACALYYHTWDNDYLDFFERTMDRIFSTQDEGGEIPGWMNFAPSIQRYVDLTRDRRCMKVMARWGDANVAARDPARGYRSNLNVLAHAYFYTGDEKYLSTAAYRVGEFVDNQYRGEDPRYRGYFITFHSNLDQSYFMQEVPYYMAAVAQLGRDPAPHAPDRTAIRAMSREKVDGKDAYVFHARLRQERDEPFRLTLDLQGYTEQDFTAEIAAPGGEPIRAVGATPKHASSIRLELNVPKDEEREYALRILSRAQNFHCRVPITYGMDGMKEAYPIFAQGTWLGDGFRYYFNLPAEASRFRLGYQGRSWPLKFEVFNPAGQCVASDTWIGSNDMRASRRQVEVESGRDTDGWSFAITGYGQANLLDFGMDPKDKARPLFFSLGKDKLFLPAK